MSPHVNQHIQNILVMGTNKEALDLESSKPMETINAFNLSNEALGACRKPYKALFNRHTSGCQF